MSASARSRRRPSWGRMLAESQTMISLAPAARAGPGPRHRADRARPQPAGRRPARPARPAAAAGARDERCSRSRTCRSRSATLPILRDVDLAVDAGRGARRHRRERLGQVDDRARRSCGCCRAARVAAGRILLDGARAARARARREMCAVRGRDIGMVFQEPMTALNPLKTIGDQVAETVRVHGGAGRARGARRSPRATLDRVGLPRDRFPLDRYPHELSGGQRQRVVIAMAIALRPQAADRRRADHRARRHHPGADPRPAAAGWSTRTAWA